MSESQNDYLVFKNAAAADACELKELHSKLNRSLFRLENYSDSDSERESLDQLIAEIMHIFRKVSSIFNTYDTGEQYLREEDGSYVSIREVYIKSSLVPQIVSYLKFDDKDEIRNKDVRSVLRTIFDKAQEVVRNMCRDNILAKKAFVEAGVVVELITLMTSEFYDRGACNTLTCLLAKKDSAGLFSALISLLLTKEDCYANEKIVTAAVNALMILFKETVWNGTAWKEIWNEYKPLCKQLIINNSVVSRLFTLWTDRFNKALWQRKNEEQLKKKGIPALLWPKRRKLSISGSDLTQRSNAAEAIICRILTDQEAAEAICLELFSMVSSDNYLKAKTSFVCLDEMIRLLIEVGQLKILKNILRFLPELVKFVSAKEEHSADAANCIDSIAKYVYYGRNLVVKAGAVPALLDLLLERKCNEDVNSAMIVLATIAEGDKFCKTACIEAGIIDAMLLQMKFGGKADTMSAAEILQDIAMGDKEYETAVMEALPIHYRKFISTKFKSSSD